VNTAKEPPRVAGPVAHPKQPRVLPPPHAWDTHAHIFGRADKFPYAPGRGYTPPDAPVDRFIALLDHLGFAAAIRAHCSDFALRTGVPCSADIAEDLDMNPGMSIALYRVVQESLTNVARHAAGSREKNAIAYQDSAVVLTIADDGEGGQSFSGGSGDGISGMREQCHSLRVDDPEVMAGLLPIRAGYILADKEPCAVR